MKICTSSPEETFSFARDFAKNLLPGEIICMYGDLGAGKTLFAQGVASGLGVEDHVSSPTFTIVNEYEGRLPFYHFDVYRISDPDEMYETGFEDYINGGGICLIEWAELIEEIIPTPYKKITILRGEDNPGFERQIIIEDIR